jgi:hypothetical protein
VIIERNADQLHGKTCLCCDEQKEKALPPGANELKIGKHRTIRIYTKQEMREAHMCKALEEAIDAEVKIVRETNDRPPDGVMLDSQDSQDNEVVPEKVGCSGFKDEKGETVCKVGN